MTGARYRAEAIKSGAIDRPQAMTPLRWGSYQMLTGDIVVEQVEPGPEFTGIFDQWGRPMMRYWDRRPIGFDLTRGEE